MAERSQFWTTNGTGDGAAEYTMTQWLEMLRDLFTSDRYASEGVIGGHSGELAVTGSSGSSPTVTVATGAALVYGLYYQNTSPVTLSLTKPSVGTTGGRVVLRADWALQTVRAIARQSADGTSTAPSLIQTPGTTFEISLATYTVTTSGTITLTDVRDFCHATAPVYRRQGGSASDWSTAGTTNYTPGGSKIQAGSVAVTFSSSETSNLSTVTFPEAFTGKPLVFLSLYNNGSSTGRKVVPTIESISASQVQIRGVVADGDDTSNTYDVYWIAFGAE